MKRDPRIYSQRERAAMIAAIEGAAEQGKSVVVAAKELGITASIYYRWVRERALGSGAPPPDQQKRAFIAEVQKLVAQGMNVKSAVQAVGITRTSYYNWIRSTNSQAPGPSVPAMRPVEVTALAPAQPALNPKQMVHEVVTLTLIAPNGYRLEGLDVENAAALLRALA